MKVAGLHHVAVICSDYDRSRRFYTDVLGLEVIAENYREERRSWKLDLRVPGGGRIELFSFPDPPPRATGPEAAGLRHLAFTVADVEEAAAALTGQGVEVEEVRTDPYTGLKFTFFRDPDGLPLELCEAGPVGGE